MKIGVYGGTFDPPHLGHMNAARAAAVLLGLDQLLFIPAAAPPHKILPHDTAPEEDRLAMTALVADGICTEEKRPGLAVIDSIELERGGRSFTAETLSKLRERWPKEELWLLMGADMLLTFQKWRDPEKIAALARIAAFNRTGDGNGTMKQQAEHLQEEYGAEITLLTLPQIVNISSTRLRELLREDRDKARDLLWCQVYGYIIRKGLYGVSADLRHLSDDDLRCASLSMVKAKRIAHIRGCEAEAVRLAERWGADPHFARRAGILHDCTKYLDLGEQLKLCKKYGIVLDDLERTAVKLLHAKTGAAIAREVYGEPAEVCEAIFWHTTGKANMSTLDKVLYLADYIEPSRADFPGLAELRKLAYEDLNAALLMGCEMTIREMEEHGACVHVNTSQARDYLKGRDNG